MTILKWLSLIIYLGTVVVAGFVPGMIWSSHTERLENYRAFDEDVTENLNASKWDIIPFDLPNEIEEATFEYDYYVTIDSLAVVEASWRYLDDTKYEQEKERVLQKDFSEVFVDQGEMVYKMTMPGSNNEAEFSFFDAV